MIALELFTYFFTKIESDRISLYLAQGKYPVIFNEIPLSRKDEYIEV